FLADLFLKSKVAMPGAVAGQEPGPQGYFRDGKVAMVTAQTTLANTVRKAKPDFKLGAGLIPKGSAPEPLGRSTYGGFGYAAMAKVTKYPDQSWALLNYLITPDPLKMWIGGLGFMSISPKVDFYPEDPVLSTAQKNLQFGVPWPYTGWVFKFWDIESSGIESFILGQRSVEDATKDMAVKNNQPLKTEGHQEKRPRGRAPARPARPETRRADQNARRRDDRGARPRARPEPAAADAQRRPADPAGLRFHRPLHGALRRLPRRAVHLGAVPLRPEGRPGPGQQAVRRAAELRRPDGRHDHPAGVPQHAQLRRRGGAVRRDHRHGDRVPDREPLRARPQLLPRRGLLPAPDVGRGGRAGLELPDGAAVRPAELPAQAGRAWRHLLAVRPEDRALRDPDHQLVGWHRRQRDPVPGGHARHTA